MENMILYDFVQCRDYSLKELVDDYGKKIQGDLQGIVFREYDEEFLNATYWQRKMRKVYKYSIEKGEFVEGEEDIVSVAEFGVRTKEKKLLVFGNKQVAQKVITLIGLISNNAYAITEYFVDIERLVNRICCNEAIEFQKMKLMDITIDKDLLVNCNVNLFKQERPKEIVLRYIKNIVVIAFRFEESSTNITISKTGRVSIGRVFADDKEELLQKIIQLTC